MSAIREFDIIIVGAGSAGCVLAARLTEEPSRRVLLIEAGGSDDRSDVHIPAAFTKLFKTERDWNHATEAQQALLGRSLYSPRGRMLGGSSSMNANMYVRGHRADYDEWEKLGCTGWNWESALEGFHRAERCADGPDGVYGTDGPLIVERQRSPNETTARFLDACASLGMARLPDMNVPDNEGCAETRVTHRRGRRWSAADAYLHPARQRGNLTLFTEATVHRVLFEHGRAIGVEYANARGKVTRVLARRGVVLSAGAYGSPQILLLSGVGPAAELERHGIPVVADRAGVGENFHDHVACPVLYHCPRPITLMGAESPLQLLKYLAQKKGMLTSCVGEAAAFIKTRPELEAPDVELIWAPVPYIDHGLTVPPGHGLTVGVVLVDPKSRGTLRLSSADPAMPPRIDPRMLADDEGVDMAAMVAGVKKAMEIADAAPLAEYVGEPMEPSPKDRSDEAIAQHIREQAFAFYHPVGTCRMGSDPDAVVDPELRVKGVDRLHVVDASVMPRVNRGHTHAPTVMIAERAAQMF